MSLEKYKLNFYGYFVCYPENVKGYLPSNPNTFNFTPHHIVDGSLNPRHRALTEKEADGDCAAMEAPLARRSLGEPQGV